MESEKLHHAADLLREGKFDEARVLIAKFLQQNPKSDDGWVLLSYAIADSEKKLECVQRALQINPENQQAQERMAELTVTSVGPPPVEEPDVAFLASEPLEESEESATPSDEIEDRSEPLTSAKVVDPTASASTDEPDEDVTPITAEDWARTAVPLPPESSDEIDGAGEAIPLAEDDWVRTATPLPPEPSEEIEDADEAVPLTAEDWARTAAPLPHEPSEQEDPEVGATPLPEVDQVETSASQPHDPEAELESLKETTSIVPEPQKKPVEESTPKSAEKPSDRWGVMVAAHGNGEGEQLSEDVLDESSMAQLRQKSTQRRLGLAVPLAVIGIFLAIAICAGAVLVGYPMYQEYRASVEATRSVERAIVAAAVATSGGNVELPPTWTPTITPTITNTPTPRPTNTATATPTLLQPDATEKAEMEIIITEVSDLRGLSVKDTTASYLLTKPKVRPILENMFLVNGGTLAEVEDQKRGLVALGLVKPTYNLYDNILNNIADGLGGFYDPQSKQLFVIGYRFGGIEHYIFSHEYDHALVDQHFHLDEMGVYPLCVTNEDHCRAIRALVEGDATLLMDQWWEQYASPQDYEDIFNYHPPRFTLPEQFPPPYSIMEADFPYSYGLIFVDYLFQRGNWAEVNKAYGNPPQSTEQILHPAKYVAGEKPLLVSHPAIADVLGETWRPILTDTMGEWGTYLLLGYGADVAAQLEDRKAESAARGWGGDSYQIFYNDDQEATLLAARWTWDTQADSTEFFQAMLAYMTERFRGSQVDGASGACWEVNEQFSCVYQAGLETLWLLAPDSDVLQSVVNLYPNFP